MKIIPISFAIVEGAVGHNEMHVLIGFQVVDEVLVINCLPFTNTP